MSITIMPSYIGVYKIDPRQGLGLVYSAISLTGIICWDDFSLGVINSVWVILAHIKYFVVDK